MTTKQKIKAVRMGNIFARSDPTSEDTTSEEEEEKILLTTSGKILRYSTGEEVNSGLIAYSDPPGSKETANYKWEPDQEFTDKSGRPVTKLSKRSLAIIGWITSNDRTTNSGKLTSERIAGYLSGIEYKDVMSKETGNEEGVEQAHNVCINLFGWSKNMSRPFIKYLGKHGGPVVNLAQYNDDYYCINDKKWLTTNPRSEAPWLDPASGNLAVEVTDSGWLLPYVAGGVNQAWLLAGTMEAGIGNVNGSRLVFT